ncbi:MAG: ATP-grasp domain-containing protein [Phycisphaerae bacterium]|nr:MAG: ATP-grasp domain-containing protein [Planctomycetota bacterium]KAB2948230.1 MAG: ATP-grasp domain-containing protein [Phycisphaerae bacterium]MBE7457863.1 ATP-grasp domain-containing protein [Planctomycetia bacterium]MCK6465740.1 ATP-grasp domain-containing protein [Phycisphaerae bacterium]MCL4719074.1 ATP-grasp domain-containing protein [Phycisphaerae bacterium]
MTAGASGEGPRDVFNVLFTCVGRRVELLDAFRRAAVALRLNPRVHGADVTPLAPGMHHVDEAHLVPRIDSPHYVPALLDLVDSRRVRLIVPSIDPDLPVLAAGAADFLSRGCAVLVSEPHVIETCRDKLRTHQALRLAGLDTPDTWRLAEFPADGGAYPVYMKPRYGSAARGNFVVHSARELDVLGARVSDPIVQEYVEGVEHTLDVYCGLDGVPRCVVPRRRLEVRSGEVSKSLIVRDDALMTAGRRVVEALPGCRGVVTVQVIQTRTGRIRVIEINPRFGGGAPLSIHAGADFPRWILQTLLGNPPVIDPLGFTDDVAMLRFDRSVFVEHASKRSADLAS